MIVLPTFSQWGQAWSSKKLGTSPFALATDGCYVTSLTSLLWAYKIELDPGQALDKLNDAGALGPDGFMNYQGVETAFPWVKFYDRLRTSNDPTSGVQKKEIGACLSSIKKLIDLGNPVILTVDNIKNDGIPDHAICAKDYILDSSGFVKDFKIMDPDGGRDIKFSDKFGDVWKKLYGYIAFIGPTVMFRDGTPEITKSASQALWKLSQVKKYHKAEIDKLQRGFYTWEAMGHFLD